MMANDYRQGFKPRPNEFPVRCLLRSRKFFKGNQEISCLVAWGLFSVTLLSKFKKFKFSREGVGQPPPEPPPLDPPILSSQWQ